MAHLAYFRVSTTDQSVEAQRHALLDATDGNGFAKEFCDEGISGASLAFSRPGFSALAAYAREGDTVHVYAVDRLGRDALDVQTTVRRLLEDGVSINVFGLGRIAKGAGELILAVLAQVADMERRRILERTELGRQTAREFLERTGQTHRGKASLGRPPAADKNAVIEWKVKNRASISQTASHFKLSVSTVKRYCA